MGFAHRVAVVGLSVILVACSASPLTFEVPDTCSSISAVDLTAQSGGFTPGGEYTSEIKGPDDKLSTGPAGKAHSDGTTPNWRFDCYNKPLGRYTVTITDTSTGLTATDSFVVT